MAVDKALDKVISDEMERSRTSPWKKEQEVNSELLGDAVTVF
jgi:hypothetical protein